MLLSHTKHNYNIMLIGMVVESVSDPASSPCSPIVVTSPMCNYNEYAKNYALFKQIYKISPDTELSHKSMYDMQDPLGMYCVLKATEEVVIPDELATGRGKWSGVCPHLRLKGEGKVVRVTKVKIAR